MPYQVFGDRSGAVAVTVTCTRSARKRSSGVIVAMLSKTACKPSAFLAPFLPSVRSSAARAFIASRSSGLNPADSPLAVLVAIDWAPFLPCQARSPRPSVDRLVGNHAVALLDT